MNVTPTEKLPEVLVIEPDVYGDSRGYFMETYQRSRYASHGVSAEFVQDNLSYSLHGVLRGLHYQLAHPQGKLVYAADGELFDVAVDIRVGSPTFGVWAGVTISAENHRQLYIPPGFAHGFCVTGESARFIYKCTDYYDSTSEFGIAWDDPVLGIEWPVDAPMLSEKDVHNPRLQEMPREHLPAYAPKGSG